MGEAILLAAAEIQFHTIYARLAFLNFERAAAFDSAISESLEQLGGFPHSAPEYLERYRRLVLVRFSYALFYVIEGQRIFVHAILDTRQSHEAIRRQLGLPPR